MKVLKAVAVLLGSLLALPAFLPAHGGHDHGEKAFLPESGWLNASTMAVRWKSTGPPFSVGRLAHLEFDVKALGRERLDNSLPVELSLNLIEDHVTITKMPGTARNGVYSLEYSFMDGSDHQMELKVWPSAHGSQPEVFTWIIPVEAKAPPWERVVKSLSLLGALVALGMLLGLAAGKMWMP